MFFASIQLPSIFHRTPDFHTFENFPANLSLASLSWRFRYHVLHCCCLNYTRYRCLLIDTHYQVLVDMLYTRAQCIVRNTALICMSTNQSRSFCVFYDKFSDVSILTLPKAVRIEKKHKHGRHSLKVCSTKTATKTKTRNSNRTHVGSDGSPNLILNIGPCRLPR